MPLDLVGRNDVPMDATPAPTAGTKPVLVRVLRIVAWLAAIALVLFILDQLGVPVSDWIRDFFDQLGAVPAYAIAGESCSAPCRPCSSRWPG